MVQLGMRLVLFFLIVSVVFAQQSTLLKALSTTRFADAVYEAVSMGSVKDTMKCNSSGDIFTPVNRGYSSAYGGVVEIATDGRHYRRFSLDGVAPLRLGHVEDFEIADDQSVYLLAREVKEYTESEVPKIFGATYVVKYSENGEFLSQTKLIVDFKELRPTAFSVLSSGDFLVVGYSSLPDKRVKVFAQVFAADASLKRDVAIPGTGIQRSNFDTVSSMSVIRPTIVQTDKTILVLRGATREPVYVFSKTAELIRTVQLDPPDIEFSSPMISRNRLIVHQHQLPLRSGTMLREVRPDVFPVFDLSSGRRVEQYSWKQSGELACYRDNLLTIVHNQSEGDVGSWVAFQVRPDSGERPPLKIGPITFQFRQIVSCGDHGKPVPLHNDDTGTDLQYCLADDPIVTENDVASAEVYLDPSNGPGLRLRFTPEGSEKMYKATLRLVGEQVGVVVDGELKLKTIIMEPLRGEAVIVGQFKADELSNWADRLNARSGAQQPLHKL